MLQGRRIRSVLSVLALATVFVTAQPAQAELSLLQFQANGYSAFQKNGGDTYTGQISWNPTYGLSDSMYLRGNLGAALLKGVGTTFPSFNAQALFGMKKLVSSLGAEAGGGIQLWPDNGGTAPIVSLNLPWMLDQKLFGLVDRIFAGGSMFLLTNTTYEARLGVGISI